MIVQRHLAPAAPPPRNPGVQRRPDDPGRRRRVPLHRAPGRPRLRERLGHELLGRVPVTDHREDRPEAGVAVGLVEPGEPRLILCHDL